MTTAHVAEETCSRAAVAHGGHLWLWHDRWHRCPGVAPASAPELTVDLLIAKYEGRRLGLLDALASGRLTATAQAETLAREDEVDRILTDLRALRATQEA